VCCCVGDFAVVFYNFVVVNIGVVFVVIFCVFLLLFFGIFVVVRVVVVGGGVLKFLLL